MKFGVREICDVVFKATDDVTIGDTTFAAGQPVLYIDTAKTSSLESAATTVYATGGRGNARLMAWEGEKTLTFTVEDAVLSPLGLSVLTGAGLINPASNTTARVHTTLEGTVKTATAGVGEADDEVVVEVPLTALQKSTTDTTVAVAVAATDPKMYGIVVDKYGSVIKHLGDAVITAGGAGGTAGTIDATHPLVATFSVADMGAVVATDTVVLDFYTIETVGVTELQIEAAKFAGSYYVEASTLFRDTGTGTDLPAEIILPLVKIQSNFTFAMAASGDPSTFSFVMDAFPAKTNFTTKKVLCAIQILDPTTAAG